MRRETGWVVALASVAVLATAWVTTADYLPALRGVDDTRDSGVGDPAKSPRPQQPTHDSSDSAYAQVPGWLDVVFTTLLLLLALALLLIVIGANVRRRRRRRALRLLAEQQTDPLDGPDDAQLATRLARSAGDSLARLHEGDPRNAIVRCWVSLEQTVESAGLPRDPAFTSEEFTSEVLRGYAVTPAAIDELAALYREARFSAHDLEEAHRRRALEALHTLREELERSSPAPAVAGQDQP